MPKSDFLKNFPRVYFLDKVCVIDSPSTSKGWKGGHYTCFLKTDIASENI